jgi:asparagine synthase (glutamine-hydrolysing)
MLSASQRFVVAFNGEIYNFRSLRVSLEACGHRFRGHSDTEVLLAAIAQWGMAKSLRQFVGMFSFALWDREERTLYLARDRIGEKPLYYGWAGGVFLFGSELKALRSHPNWEGSIDRKALALFMRHDYIPSPYSIYQGISKLLPGTFLTLHLSALVPHHAPLPVPYWSAREVAEAGAAAPFQGSEAEAVAHLDALLREAVHLQMVADVPLGAFLSGGIDSSTVVALMQSQSEHPVRTFTIGVPDAAYNEADHARAVAQHLGTDHTELDVTPSEALEVIPRLPTLYDEPFADSSQIPTFLVSALTRKSVTVSLSGDGGDELFGGYPRYQSALNTWNMTAWIPEPGRYALSRVCRAIPPQVLDTTLSWLTRKLNKGRPVQSLGDKLQQRAEIIAADSFETYYHLAVSHWNEPASLVIGSGEWPTFFTDRNQQAALSDIAQRMLYLDLLTYLPDDILTKVDRASMGVSLESRMPLLDHRVVEFAWQVPISMKLRNGKGKWLLRQILYRYVPEYLVEHPKTGFSVPIDAWLRGPLREWAESLLDERRLREEGFLNPQPVRKTWLEHLAGVRTRPYHLWNVLMFQAWLGKST